MMCKSECAELLAVSTNSRCSVVSFVPSARSIMPMIPFIGVRISCDILARKLDLATFAASASRRAISSTRINSRRSEISRSVPANHFVAPTSTETTASSVGTRAPLEWSASTSMRRPSMSELPVKRKRARPFACATRCSVGTRTSESLRPTTSFAGQPNVFSAAGLKFVISPFSSINTIASNADSRTARICCSA